MALGLGLSLSLGGGTRLAVTPKPTICDAIAQKVCITAILDGEPLKLAPHIVYKRGKKETITLDAVLIARGDHPVNHQSLRTYNVADLLDITVTDEGFTVFSGFEADDTEYAGRTVCIVQTV